MAITITHAFVSAVADGGVASLVQPSNWNAALVSSMGTGFLVGRTTAGTGVFEEITLSADFSFSGGNLSLSGAANITLGQVLAIRSGMPLP